MNIREQVAERLQIARKKIGMTQSELANNCGYSRGRVSNWENASRMPKVEEFRQLARVLKVSPSWLFCATDDISIYDTGNTQIVLVLVPVFNLDHLANANTFAVLNDKNKRENYIQNNATIALSLNRNISEKAKIFAVNLSDSSMEPEIKQQDIVLIDPNVAPMPSKYVLAKINQNLVIRKYRKPTNAQIELVPINPDWPSQTFAQDDKSVQMIGTVVELRRSIL